ncbi:MAG TPA: hypothetical protein VFP12_03930 [Allosphingosinicella sp.]|nr:hypothetical protein [Allosphingosinicella sp.]
MKALSYFVYGFEGSGGRYLVLETRSAAEARDLRLARVCSGFPTVVFSTEGELTTEELDRYADLDDRFS